MEGNDYIIPTILTVKWGDGDERREWKVLSVPVLGRVLDALIDYFLIGEEGEIYKVKAYRAQISAYGWMKNYATRVEDLGSIGDAIGEVAYFKIKDKEVGLYCTRYPSLFEVHFAFVET